MGKKKTAYNVFKIWIVPIPEIYRKGTKKSGWKLEITGSGYSTGKISLHVSKVM